MIHAKKFLPLLLAAAAFGLAACGGSSSGGDSVSGSFEALPEAPAGDKGLAGEAELTRSDGGTEVKIELTGLEPETAYVAHLHTGGCAGSDPGGPHFQFEKGGAEEPPNEIHLEFESDGSGAGEASAKSEREVPEGEAGSVVVHLADGHHSEMSALFVHEEGEHGQGEDHGEMEDEHHADKIACAALEGDAGGGASASVPTIEVRDGEPVGGIEKIEVSAGEQVRFRVHSDVAEEVHVHGYDLMKDVPAGGTVEFDFPADIEGIFEAELEGVGVQILELRVNP